MRRYSKSDAWVKNREGRWCRARPRRQATGIWLSGLVLRLSDGDILTYREVTQGRRTNGWRRFRCLRYMFRDPKATSAGFKGLGRRAEENPLETPLGAYLFRVAEIRLDYRELLRPRGSFLVAGASLVGPRPGGSRWGWARVERRTEM
jgi:hypothetical protein